LERFELFLDERDGLCVVLEVHELVALGAVVVVFERFFEVHASARVATHVELVRFFALKAFSEARSFFALDFVQEVLYFVSVDVPVADVPAFLLVFLAFEDGELVFVAAVEDVAAAMNLKIEVFCNDEFGNVLFADKILNDGNCFVADKFLSGERNHSRSHFLFSDLKLRLFLEYDEFHLFDHGYITSWRYAATSLWILGLVTIVRPNRYYSCIW